MSNWKIFYGITGFLGMITMVLEISLYYQTIISAMVPIGIMILVGIIVFIPNKNHYNKTYATSGFFFPLCWNIISWGFLTSYLFLAINFYMASANATDRKFKIESRDSMPGEKGNRNKRHPTIKIDYSGFKKELVFNYSELDQVNKADSVLLTTKKGALGFDVISRYSVVN